MAHRTTDSFSRPNDTYQSIRDQLERQTSALMQERNSLNLQRPSNTYFPSYRHQQPSPRSKISHQPYHRASSNLIDANKKAQIKHRIKQIIDLCRDENAAVTRDVNGVMQSQRGIYNLLQQAELDQTRVPPQTHAPVAPIPSAPYTPIRAQSQQVHPGKALQKDTRSILQQNRHIQLSQQALQLIEWIQRRSLAEIQKLRDEKLVITGQLNEQIRRNNGDKRRIEELERELDYYRRNQGNNDNKYQSQLKAKVAYLQNILQQTSKTGQFPDFNLLYAQGEAIRQDTIRLLKLKQAKMHSDDQEKKRLREEVNRLQKRLQQLQLQRSAGRGKLSYGVIDQQYSPIAPSHKHKDSHRNSANEYQSLVMEMRKITSN